MYGGFTLAQQGLVMIAVLQGLRCRRWACRPPRLIVRACGCSMPPGADLLTNTSGRHHRLGLLRPHQLNGGCTTPSRADSRWTRNDSCIRQRTLAAGVYTFTINPSTAGTSGEVLFEVTFSH
jgi:hypothetical protein